MEKGHTMAHEYKCIEFVTGEGKCADTATRRLTFRWSDGRRTINRLCEMHGDDAQRVYADTENVTITDKKI